MVDLCIAVTTDLSAMEGLSAAIKGKGSALANRASKLQARISSCGSRAMEQVIFSTSSHQLYEDVLALLAHVWPCDRWKTFLLF